MSVLRIRPLHPADLDRYPKSRAGSPATEKGVPRQTVRRGRGRAGRLHRLRRPGGRNAVGYGFARLQEGEFGVRGQPLCWTSSAWIRTTRDRVGKAVIAEMERQMKAKGSGS